MFSLSSSLATHGSLDNAVECVHTARLPSSQAAGQSSGSHRHLTAPRRASLCGARIICFSGGRLRRRRWSIRYIFRVHHVIFMFQAVHGHHQCTELSLDRCFDHKLSCSLQVWGYWRSCRLWRLVFRIPLSQRTGMAHGDWYELDFRIGDHRAHGQLPDALLF